MPFKDNKREGENEQPGCPAILLRGGEDGASLMLIEPRVIEQIH